MKTTLTQLAIERQKEYESLFDYKHVENIIRRMKDDGWYISISHGNRFGGVAWTVCASAKFGGYMSLQCCGGDNPLLAIRRAIWSALTETVIQKDMTISDYEPVPERVFDALQKYRAILHHIDFNTHMYYI